MCYTVTIVQTAGITMSDQAPLGSPPVLLLAAFHDAFPDQAIEWVIRAPGRDMWIAAARSGDDRFTIAAPDQDGRVTFNLQSAKLKQTVMKRPLPRWARYPAGVTLLLARDGLDVVGLNLVFMGGEPSGPRFDYAVGISFAALWHELYGLTISIDQLIDIVDRTRREYVGE